MQAYSGELRQRFVIGTMRRASRAQSFVFKSPFKKEMGVNFLDFVVECKVDEAKRLLRETDHNVSEIAMAVGIRA